MDASEYIEAVTGQMRSKRARGFVAKEIADHIEDQTQSYLEAGMTLAEAQKEAVCQMGDAVEVGTELDRIHRPRMDKRSLTLIAVFSVAACILQTIIIGAQKKGGNLFVSSKLVPFQVLLGVVVMIAILYWDYTRLEKYAVKLWIGMLVFFVLHENMLLPGISYYAGWRIGLYWIQALSLPLYAAIVYRYRIKRWRGILCSLLWLAVASFFCYELAPGVLQVIMMCFICLFVLSYAIAKGWYGVRRIPALCALWGTLLGGCMAFIGYVFTYGVEYRKSRLKMYLGFWDADAYIDVNYVSKNIKDSLNQLSLWGRGAGWAPSEVMEVSGDMSFYIILNRIGLIPCTLIIFGLLALLVTMAAGISRQKNVLGGLVGMACLMGLLVPATMHVLGNVSVLPYGMALMPFLYPGWLANLVAYTLLGFYLSVYRYTDVVA